jgi:stage V sporulation protein D (sporulation-specific penicillin-binding protein)
MALMMEKEVQVGTGKNAYVAGYRVGGKTGTSQKLDEPNNVGAVITSFVGIAPADDPQIAILLLLDEPHNVINFGGVISAPVVGNIFSEVLPYLGVKPQYTPQEEEKLDVKTPGVVGNSINDATKSLKNAGLVPEIIGNGTKVTSQIPDVGQSMPRGGKVVLYTGSQTVQDNVTIPKLTGLTPAQVNSAVAAQGLNIELVGEGLSDTGEMAYQQSPAEGTKVPPGTVVTVQFRNNDITAE